MQVGGVNGVAALSSSLSVLLEGGRLIPVRFFWVVGVPSGSYCLEEAGERVQHCVSLQFFRLQAAALQESTGSSPRWRSGSEHSPQGYAQAIAGASPRLLGMAAR